MSSADRIGETRIEPDDPDARPRQRRWFLTPLLLLAVGFVSIVLLIGTDWIRTRLVQQDSALQRVVGEMEVLLSTAHLWLEEFVTGDDIDTAEIEAGLRRAEELSELILEGGALSDTQRLKAVSDADLRRRADEIAPQIRRFREISERREAGFRRGEDVGIGSDFDAEFDDVFRLLLADLRDLDAVVNRRLDAAHARSTFLFRTILVAWIVVVALAVSGLSRLEIRRRQAERALDESEAQLRQAQKMEAVGRLAGGMAHDINNYLAAISAQCELVMMTSEEGSPIQRRMDTVVSTTTKATALIERLLSFSRRKPVQPEVVNLNRVVLDLSRLLERLIGEDIQLEKRLGKELWNVEADPSQLEQVILNLVVNAREAMPTGGKLAIETSNRTFGAEAVDAMPIPSAGDYVVLSVADTGVGVAEELRDRIFEPFVTTKKKTAQSGLGLAMVYAITEQNQGGVAVFSGEGRGATFKVYLPRSRALAQAETESRAADLPRGRGQQLLLVEDNLELRDAVAGVLSDLGYRVAVAASAEEALFTTDALESPVELLVTDVVMPGMNGRELWERLGERQPGLEVIFISGYTDDVMLRHGIEEGQFRFLQKPFPIRDLAAMIADVLRNRGEGAASGDTDRI